MPTRKILHVVGGESSVWVLAQLTGQYRLLPEDLFAQTLAAGEERVARQVENRVFQKVARLRRRLRIEYTAARNLSKLLRKCDPDLVVCWDVQATEQLKLALRGRRRQTAAALMLFCSHVSRDLEFKLKSNFHHLSLHLICASDRLCEWASRELLADRRVCRVYPVFEKAAESIDRQALRRQMGLKPDEIAVFVPTLGRMEDVQQALIACGINEKVNPKIRIVLADEDRARLDRCRNFVRRTIEPPILRVVRGWDPRQVIGGCDLVVQPVRSGVETLALVEAMGRSVPVVSTAPAEPAEFFVPDETYRDATRVTGRGVGSVIFKLLSDPDLANRLTQNAKNTIQQHCSPSEYRAAVVKLYQQLLNQKNL